MRARGLGRLLLAGICLLLLAVSCSPADVAARLGEELRLKVGQTAILSGESLEVSFLDVLEDSRCPRGVTCVWEGRVRASMAITIHGETAMLELVQPGLTDAPSVQQHGGYSFTFSVDPYPEAAGEEIAVTDYAIHLTVTR